MTELGILQDALQALLLEEKNWKIAKEYFDRVSEDEGLLEDVVYQDFGLLTENQKKACLDCCEAIQWQPENMKMRYTKFVAEVGRASAYYVLVKDGNIGWCMKWFSKEQLMAIRTEMYAHTAETLQQGCLSVLYGLGKSNTTEWYQAMNLCRMADDTARMLMGAVYLYCLTIKKTDNDSGEEIRTYLERRLLERLPEVFLGAGLSEAETLRIRKFVLEGLEYEQIPEDIYMIFRGKQSSRYMVTFLAGCAYLALGQRRSFGMFLRLMAAVDGESGRNEILNVLRYMVDRMWFYEHLDFLMNRLPVSKEFWVKWSFVRQEQSIWMMVIRKYPEEVKKAVGSMDLWEYENTMQHIKRINPEFHQEIYHMYAKDYRQKAAKELVTNYETGEDEARRYLLGEISLEEILPFVKEWRKNGSGYYGNKMARLEILSKDTKNQQIYERAVVLEGILMRGTYFAHYLYTSVGGDKNKSAEEWDIERIDYILSIFQREQVPMSYQLDMLACMYEDIYPEIVQKVFQRECITVLSRHIDEWKEAYQKAALEGAARARIFCICVLSQYAKEYKKTLLACASDSSKQVQEVLLTIYAAHREWEADILLMLASKKQKERQMAMEVLVTWDSEHYREVLLKALETEKNAKIAERLRRLLGAENEMDIEKIIANLLKGGRRQKVAWAFEQPYKVIHRLDGSEAPKEYLQAIMVSYASMSTLGIHKEALLLADKLQKAELHACMTELFQRWLSLGAEAKKRWVLYAASIHGGEEIIPLLYQQIKEFPANSRGAMGAEAVRALALNGSSTALLLVDQISRKFKYRQVKKAAFEALEYAAKELGISREELEDKIVPDLGFDARSEQSFDYGTRSFTIRLMPSMELEIYNGQGKRLKNLPAPGKQDDEKKATEAYNAYKLMKKQLKTVVAGQKLRMEQALLNGRLWKMEHWQALFAQNPLMHPFAMGLVWGVYQQGVLQDTFRYMEDGTFNTAYEEEYQLPEDGMIGLLHPVEVSKDILKAWKEQFSDYEMVQPIEQLSREVYRPTEEELDKTKLTRFEGTVLNGCAFSANLMTMGWMRGPIGDNAEYDMLCREDQKIRTELHFSGCGVVFDNTEVVLYEINFYQPKENKTPCLISELAPRYFSEIVYQVTCNITKMTSSGSH